MTRWSRRQALTSIAAAAAMAPLRLPAMAPEGGESLDQLARAKGLRFGTAVGGRFAANAALVELVKAQCSLIVPENELKMPSIQPVPGEFRFDRAEAMLAFAESSKMLMRGHCLLWHHP